MKREAFNHPKMLDLASRLAISMTHARGVMSTLWNWAADTAFCGDVGKWNDGVIARACDWTGDAAEFVEALVGAGWLDRCVVHRLVIHDLEEHAPEWWKTKLKRINKTFVSATQSSEASQVSGANLPASVPVSTHANAPANTPGSALLCSALLSSALQTKPIARKRAVSFTVDDVKFPPELDTPEARTSAAAWLDHKRDKGSPYKNPDTFAALLTGMARAGPAAFVAAVAWSRQQNYAGLFAPPQDSKNAIRQKPNAGQVYTPGDELGPV